MRFRGIDLPMHKRTMNVMEDPGMKSGHEDTPIDRREWMKAGVAGAASGLWVGSGQAQTDSGKPAEVVGEAYWAIKKIDGRDIRLFMWNKHLAASKRPYKATVLLVHGSSVSSTPVYDLKVQIGRAHV